MEYPFDESVGWAEDQLWADRIQKAGYKTVYQPCASVFHSHNLTLKQNFERCYKYYLTLFATIYKDQATEKRNVFRASLVERALSLSRFLVQRQLMHPLQALFYSPFCEYINFLGCEVSWQKMLKGSSKQRIDMRAPTPQPQNQVVT